MVVPRSLACLTAALCLVTLSQAADKSSPVYISELMPGNQPGLKDEDGEPAGWIELYNGGGAPLNLNGWYLTNSRTNLTKWRLPAVSLLPEKYLLIFASGKDRSRDLLHLHTSFRLNAEGGYLALVNRSTNIVSELAAYPKLAASTSYGRVPGDPTAFGTFVHPTPGKLNATDGPGFSPEVTISPAGGTFTNSVVVELRCASSNAVIHFTVDGSVPTAASPVYETALKLTKTSHIRARAYEAGLLPGPPRGAEYLLLDPGLLTFTSNLPVLVMSTLGQDQSDYGSDAVVQLTVFEPSEGRTSLSNSPSTTVRAGYHVRGSSTMDMPKSSFVLHVLNEFSQEQHQRLLGMPADSDWILYAPNRYEPVLIHNPFIHQLSRDLGRYSPRTRFVEVYLVRRSGALSRRAYQGIYVLEEKIKVGKHRVDIDRLGPGDLKEPEITGGYLMKLDRLGPGEDGFWTSEASVVYIEPKERVITLPERAPQRQFLSDYFKAFEHALHGPKWKDPVLGYRAYIDVGAWIDYPPLEVPKEKFVPCRTGPYRFMSDPMYTVGYLQTYGIALACGSWHGLAASLFAQASILLVNEFVEKPHFRRLCAAVPAETP